MLRQSTREGGKFQGSVAHVTIQIQVENVSLRLAWNMTDRFHAVALILQRQHQLWQLLQTQPQPVTRILDWVDRLTDQSSYHVKRLKTKVFVLRCMHTDEGVYNPSASPKKPSGLFRTITSDPTIQRLKGDGSNEGKEWKSFISEINRFETKHHSFTPNKACPLLGPNYKCGALFSLQPAYFYQSLKLAHINETWF